MSCIPQLVQCSNTTSVELDVCDRRLEPKPHADGGCIPAPRRVMPYPRTSNARDSAYCPGGKNRVPAPCLSSAASALSTAVASSVVPSPTAPKSRTSTCTIPLREVADAAASVAPWHIAALRATQHAATTLTLQVQQRCGTSSAMMIASIATDSFVNGAANRMQFSNRPCSTWALRELKIPGATVETAGANFRRGSSPGHRRTQSGTAAPGAVFRSAPAAPGPSKAAMKTSQGRQARATPARIAAVLRHLGTSCTGGDAAAGPAAAVRFRYSEKCAICL